MNQRRAKTGLKPRAEATEGSRIVRLYTVIQIKNCGTETANVRLNRINGSIVKYLTLPQLKGCGLAPGIMYQAVVEVQIDINGLRENIFDAVVLKTQEEVLSIPLSVIMFENEVENSGEDPQHFYELGEDAEEEITDPGLDACCPDPQTGVWDRE